MGVVWLGAVGSDWVRSSDITFQPFENSWVGVSPEGPSLGLVKSVVVRPFVGDPMMAARWIAVFEGLTDRVDSQGAQPQSVVAHRHCVLIGNVVSQEPQKTVMGLKETSSHRLYLRLMTDSGVLLWKTELPYIIVKGAKELDERRVRNALLTHVKEHANEIGLAGLGGTIVQVASQERAVP